MHLIGHNFSISLSKTSHFFPILYHIFVKKQLLKNNFWPLKMQGNKNCKKKYLHKSHFFASLRRKRNSSTRRFVNCMTRQEMKKVFWALIIFHISQTCHAIYIYIYTYLHNLVNSSYFWNILQKFLSKVRSLCYECEEVRLRFITSYQFTAIFIQHFAKNITRRIQSMSVFIVENRTNNKLILFNNIIYRTYDRWKFWYFAILFPYFNEKKTKVLRVQVISIFTRFFV